MAAFGLGAVRGSSSRRGVAALVGLETLANAARVIDDETRKADLMREADLLFAQAQTGLAGPDLEMVQGRYHALGN